MKKIITVLFAFVGIMLTSCDTSVVDKEDVDVSNVEKEEVQGDSEINALDQIQEVSDMLSLDNGIKIKWFEHGNGEKLAYADLVAIDYKVLLDDGTIVDGNELLKKESIPYILGFGMQTKGWDIALKELTVGDFAEIYIPSNLARGEKGIPGLIPANANNTLKVRVLDKIKPTREIDGCKVWVFEENKSNTELFGEGNQIEFDCIASTPSKRDYINTFRQSKPFTLKLEDYGTIPGLKKALINAKRADRMIVYIPSSEAYGTKGYLDLVKPNEDLMYNILVSNVIKE
ncbi:MAG: FKBP-type peptidyl-prolyl cis-trans isomerase [Crocinitomicaceae bacterium]|nr:FKBP-type peptidyl-prolyl cis-trans isomerase [Crocinitomicaceae bacterium]